MLVINKHIKYSFLMILIIAIMGCTKTSTVVETSNDDNNNGNGNIDALLPAPTVSTVAKNSDLTVKIDWSFTSSGSSKLTGFVVNFKKPNEIGFTQLVTLDSIIRTYTTRTDNFRLDKGFGTYQFRVHATSTSGQGPFSTTYSYAYSGPKAFKERWTAISPQHASHPSSYDQPYNLAIQNKTTLSDTRAFLVDTENHRILKLNVNQGGIIDSYPSELNVSQTNVPLGGKESTNSKVLQFDTPRDVAFGLNNLLWVADYGNNRVVGFDPSDGSIDPARFESTKDFESSDASIGEFYSPTAIEVIDGFLYVADNWLNNTRVQKLKIDVNNNIVVNESNDQIQHSDIVFIQDITGYKNSSNQTIIFVLAKVSGANSPHKIFAFVNGIYNATRTASITGGFGTGLGTFNNPKSILIDPSTEILYVTDTNNNQIQQFIPDANGNFSYSTFWGTEGTDKGEFMKPTGIEIDNFGNLYITEIESDQIQVFKNL